MNAALSGSVALQSTVLYSDECERDHFVLASADENWTTICLFFCYFREQRAFIVILLQ